MDIEPDPSHREAAMKFVHVATRTKDLDKAIAFYGMLGLQLQRKKELTANQATLAFLAQPEGDFAIELVYNWGKDTPYEGGQRFGHFAFDVDDLDLLFERLVKAGATPVRRPALLQDEGPKIAFIADPDGNEIELIER